MIYKSLVLFFLAIISYASLTKDKTKQYVCKFEATEEVVYCTENIP